MAAQLDWLLLHQANQRILEAVATRLGTPEERVLSNLACYGNTSAATIPSRTILSGRHNSLLTQQWINHVCLFAVGTAHQTAAERQDQLECNS